LERRHTIPLNLSWLSLWKYLNSRPWLQLSSRKCKREGHEGALEYSELLGAGGRRAQMRPSDTDQKSHYMALPCKLSAAPGY